MPLCRTYASLDVLDGGPPQHTALFQPNPFSVSPAPHSAVSAHYDCSQLSQTTVLFQTPVASPISRQSSPLGPYWSRSSLPDRPIFPCSKPDPSLYRSTLMRRFKSSPRGQEFFYRRKISALVTDALTKRKHGGGGVLQSPATIPTGSCIAATGVDLEVVDGMA